MAIDRTVPNFWGRFGARRAPRIIDPFLEELIELLEENPVAVLTAGTSAGKTSRVPQALALAYPDNHVWMSQPRRKAVRKNGRWIAHEMGARPGELVGWRLAGSDGESRESSATRIHLRVDQSLVNQIINAEGRLPEGFIIVDEAHERSIAIDLLLGLLKEGLPKSPNTKVIITSATIDARKFSEFFDGAPVIEVPGKRFSIHEEVIRLGKFEHHTQAAVRGACTALDKFLAGEPLVPSLEGEGLASISKGTVLVLLPGKEDIRDMMQAVQRHAERQNAKDRVEVLECHGETESAADDLIDQPLDEGKLRFVCATEVVRTSVTISEICGVIDSLQIKRPIADAKGVVHLQKIAISRAEAEQGKGRGGRERTAFYWPCSFESEYERLESHPRPAVLYSPIESVALTVAAIGKSIRTFPLLDRPEEARIGVALQRLQRLGLLDGEEAITEFGREVERLSVDVGTGASLFMARKLGVLPEAIVAAGILENEDIFWLPRRETEIVADEWLLRLVFQNCRKYSQYSDGWEVCRPEEAAGYDPSMDLPRWVETDEEGKIIIKPDKSGFPTNEGARWIAGLVRKHWAGKEQSDFAAAMRAYRAYKAGSSAARQFLNGKKVGMVDHTIGLLREDLAGSDLRLNGSIFHEREFDGNALTKALATGLIDNVLVGRHSDRSASYAGPLGSGIELSRSSACPQRSSAVIVGGVRKTEVQGRRGSATRYFADLAAPVNPGWLADLMPQLCELKRRGDHAYDRESDRVAETQEVKFVDLVLTRKVTSEDLEGIAKALALGVGQRLYNEFAEAMSHNSRVQKDAQAFFCRSGGESRNVTGDDVVNHYATVFFLHSIRSYADWQKAEAEGRVKAANLMLSLEDFVSKEEQDRILRENPDTISVLGEDLAVRYEASGRPATPQVTLSKEVIESHSWLALPDEGIFLPGGRQLQIAPGAYAAPDTSVSVVKGRIKDSLNGTQWYAWRERPEIGLPDISDENAVIPEIIRVQYGTCVVTEEPLMAYGAVRKNPNRSYYDSQEFKAEWFRNSDEAEKAREAAAARLAEIQKDARDSRERVEAKADAEAAREELKQVCGRDGWRDLPYELRSRADGLRNSYLPSGAQELREKAEEMRGIIPEINKALAEAARLKEEEERRQRAIEARRKNGASIILGIFRSQYPRCPLCEVQWSWTERDAEDASYGWVKAPCGYCNGCDEIAKAIDAGFAGETIFFDKREATVLRRTFVGEESAMELALYYKYGCWNLAFKVDVDACLGEGEARTVKVWQEPSETAIELAKVRRMAETYADDYARAEADVEAGYSHKLSFRRGKHPKTGEEQWEAGPSYAKGYGGQEARVKFVLDRNVDFLIEEGREYFCTEYRTLVDNPGFKLIVVRAYLAVTSIEEIESRVAELEERLGEEYLADFEEEDNSSSDPQEEDLFQRLKAWTGKN